MAKGNPWDDAFEQLAELGKSTVKHTATSVKQTFDPRRMVEHAFTDRAAKNEQMGKEMRELQEKKPNATPLDIMKLQEKFSDQDKAKTDALRSRLFQMVTSAGEKALEDKKKKELEKVRQAAFAEQEKKRKEKERLQASQAASPAGKERKSIMGGKKKKKGIEPSPAEIKPSSGKQ